MFRSVIISDVSGEYSRRRLTLGDKLLRDKVGRESIGFSELLDIILKLMSRLGGGGG